MGKMSDAVTKIWNDKRKSRKKTGAASSLRDEMVACIRAAATDSRDVQRLVSRRAELIVEVLFKSSVLFTLSDDSAKVVSCSPFLMVGSLLQKDRHAKRNLLEDHSSHFPELTSMKISTSSLIGDIIW